VSHRTFRPYLGVALALVSGVLLTPAAHASPSSASPDVGYSAGAYGSTATVSGIVTSGKSALVTLGCLAQPTVTRSNTSATVNGRWPAGDRQPA